MRWTDIADKVNAIDGWLLPGQAQWLFETAQAMPGDAIILEIGGYLGHSTAALAFGCAGTKKHVFCIDTFCGNVTDFVRGKQFEGSMFAERWADNLYNAGIADYVTGLAGYSSHYYNEWDKPLDMLFIDGSHQYDDVIGDLRVFGQHVKPGGIVAMHDITPLAPWPGPYRAWCEMAETLLEGATVTCGTLGYGFKKR
jgi:predicted O-methyltransferase YrrM